MHCFKYNMNILHIDVMYYNNYVFHFKVECGGKDLHSGVFGGSVHEAMTDLIALMGKST